MSDGDIKVLLVDDSAFACRFLSRRLEAEPGVTVRAATTIAEAKAIADELLPTVVLRSSFNIGDEVFEDLRALRRHGATRDVPVVLYSEPDDPGLAKLALEEGASDVVLQSEGHAALVDRVRTRSREYVDRMTGSLTMRASPSTNVGPARVLMIDDSAMICRACERKLRDVEAVEFQPCNDPRLAIDVARDFSPTVILLDLEMPGISGFELLPMLRDDPVLRDVPVIVLSGISDPTIKAEAFRRGADDYAEKNMDEVELVGRIKYHTRAYVNARELNRSIRDLVEARRRLEHQANFIRKTFGRYLSDEIVESILETPEGLELGGEKREITIMMSDLRGFTSMGERLPPESVLTILNNYLSEMTEILQRHHGTIDEFLGDAILAMFGAPVYREDHARRAVACAIEMQLAMRKVNAWNRDHGFPEVHMGIGLNTGEVVVGNIGSERRAKYGIVGKHVNLTARIESCTVGGQVMVSQATLDACGPILRIDDVIEVLPKGVEKPINVYEIGGIGGELDLYLPEKKPLDLPELERPIDVMFQVLKGKYADKEEHPGTFTGLDESAAFLVSELDLEKLTNLRITLLDGEEIVTKDLYAKVIEPTEGAAKRAGIRFTSTPPEAAAFIDAVHGASGSGSAS